MKNIKKWIVFQFNTLLNYIDFFDKKREANNLHKLTGKYYHVVPYGKVGLKVVDNTFVKSYNSILPKGNRITHIDLMRMSYYSTPLSKSPTIR